MSYTRFDDEHNDGQLTAFRRRLSDEVRCQTAKAFPIFQDRYDLGWGRHWSSHIDAALATVSLLIPVISPSFYERLRNSDPLAAMLYDRRYRDRRPLRHPPSPPGRSRRRSNGWRARSAGGSTLPTAASCSRLALRR
ncbi:hypothetical protein [Nonomuraea basaltis]|uniref:hypothetical protein n=1 Tax=Nonomuraea basaltis TaxID=2495887 RepID=UPI001486BD48|nr:hypothetical protein [Nonomuraea basaltis]